MLQFKVDGQKCIACGECVNDCPVNIIALEEGRPLLPASREGTCLKCQHCLAICPTGAISILGLDPADSIPLGEGSYPAGAQLATLIKGRRSVRRYRDENLDSELVQELLDVAWQAPSGVNSRRVRFTVIDDRLVMQSFRADVYAGLQELVAAGKLPQEKAFFAGFVRRWQEDGIDVLFRGAPHLLVASTPSSVVSLLPDCLIALAYFELYAQSRGIGTLWDGLAKWAVDGLVPDLRRRLGIPEDHLIGYAMVFGPPALRYHRTVQHAPADVVRVPR